MPFNGFGVFNRVYSWVADKNASIDITASRMDTDTDDITTNGFGLCLTRDGQGSAQANLPMNGFKFTGLGVGSAGGDSVNMSQLAGFAPLNGTGATGTWPISISGNAVTATTATSATSATSATTAGTANALNTGNGYTMAGLSVNGSIGATGNITAGVSDTRLKDRLGGISDATKKLMSLDVFFFRLNKRAQKLGLTSSPRLGGSADQVKKILPEAAPLAPINSTMKRKLKNPYLTTDPDQLLWLAIATIQEQQRRIDALEKRMK